MAEAEQKTGGEIATAIIPESDDYGFRELLASVVIGVVVYSVLTFFAPAVETVLARVFWTYNSWMLPTAIGAIATLSGGVAYVLAQIPALDRVIVPTEAMHADRGITERVEQERWDAIVADLTDGIAGGNAGVALAEAVRAVGKILAETVERRRDDTNELPDGPTELERGS